MTNNSRIRREGRSSNNGECLKIFLIDYPIAIFEQAREDLKKNPSQLVGF